MNITYIILGVIFVVLGITMLIWFIKKPLKYEDTDEDIGADDYEMGNFFYKQANQQALVVFELMIVSGIASIYKGIMGG
ncbi:MAG: hypothetical protein WC135_04720 [Bacteroidales bacterium]